MSWMKQAQPGEGAGAGPQPYVAPQAQPFTNQQNMYPNYPGSTGNLPQPASQQGQYWQPAPAVPPQQQYNQQYGAVYQQEFAPNANQVYQQPQYNQNYSSSGYTNPQQGYQQNFYQNQQPQNYPQHRPTNSDGWEDNWDWGWDESAKQAQRAQKAQNAGQHQPVQQEPAFNNANVLEESFAPTNTWNWAMDDKKASREPAALPLEQVNNEPATIPPNPVEHNMSSETNNMYPINNGAPLPSEEVRTLNDRDVVKERIPNLALGKRFHLDNLTPQWSIESQMSQESSDGPQTHSESTYRSETQSRNSNSPGPNVDNSNFNHSQSRLEESYTQNSEWSRQSDEPTLANSTRTGSRRESHEELVHTMEDLTLVNHENISLENLQVSPVADRRSSQQSVPDAQPPPATSTLPPPMAAPHLPLPSSAMPPPPPVSAPTPLPPTASPVRPPSAGAPPTPPAVARPTAAASSNTAPPPPAVVSLPPPALPPSSNSQNPFKHAGPFVHKPKPSSSGGPGPGPGRPFSPSTSNTSLMSPAAVGKALLSRPSPPIRFEANLETTPDNSERPDAPAATAWGALPTVLHVPDNMEVAPRNDRNEYLQTAHLSSGDYGENAESGRDVAPAPPAGLRRMVVGRHEPAAERDQPPPGLSRMVPGRPTEGDGACEPVGDSYRERPAAYRRADGGHTPERRPAALARATPAGEPSAAPEYTHYARPERALDGSDNLQDLSASTSVELEPRSGSPPAPPDLPRRSSPATDRDYDASPRRNSRDRDSRYPRSDRTHEHDERRSERERRERRDRDRDRRDRDESPDARRTRRSARSHRYETEDTDYYSDKERDRRRHREGSYASRPPRPARGEDEARRHEERGSRARRHGAAAGGEGRERRDRHERAYRDIDPSRKYGNRRRDRDDEDRRRVRFSRDARPSDSSRSEGAAYSSPSRAESREATATDEEPDRRRDRRARHSTRRTVDPYYDGYGAGAGAGAGAVAGAGAYADPFLAQRAQYEYYERLRATDPAAYMQLYKRLMAAHGQDPLEGYASVGAGAALYGAREERGSVHSGRSSAAGLKGPDTYYAFRHDSLRDAPSLRTDVSDRDLTTDVSLPTNLETSTVRSDRMTPHRFSTAHVKGSVSSRHVVVVRPSWPVDGFPATVQLLALPHALQRDPLAAELASSPGPLVKGVTHKKSVIEYCMSRVRGAARETARDAAGYGLVWELLALLLRQNGVVVGSDIAELLMKNTREHEYKTTTHKARNESRRGSSVSGSAEEARSSPDCAEPSVATNASAESSPPSVDEAAALDKLREHLLYGNRQEALEWAMSCNLWGHALHLAAFSERRTRGAVAARFLAATPRADPLHTLYASLAAATPPAAACVSEERWGDWRPHAAIILANAGARPDHDTRTLTMLGDSLASRGLLYSAQFCYVVGGVPFARHPLAPLAPAAQPATGAPAPAPPRLSLLLAEPRARSLLALASPRAILATEIYEYALSLNQDYVIPELQVYKFLTACRLVDCGQYERALAYVEQAARAVTRAPRDYSPRLLRNLADMADRLKYHDPTLLEDPPLLEEGDAEGSPRHQQWLQDVQTIAQTMQAEAQAQQAAPQLLAADYYGQQQYSWDQAQHYQQQQTTQLPPVAQPAAEPEEPADYSQQYYPPPPAPAPAPPAEPEPDVTSPQYAYDDWNRTEEHHAQHYGESTYWQGDNTYGYGEPSGEGGEGGAPAEQEPPRPVITMPGARAPPRPYGLEDDDRADTQQQAERDTDTPKSSRTADGKPKEAGGKGEGGKGGGWLGGILTKLSLRPPNQMILPDDKNPTIVWDADNKRWRNLDGEEAEGEQPPPPPPRMADLVPQLRHQNTSTPNQSPAAPAPGAGAPPPVSNIFKMQKGRHIKKSYVDVFNPSGAATRALPPAAAVLGPAPALSPNPNYFVPAPHQTVHVLIPPSPPDTAHPAPAPAPAPAPVPEESGDGGYDAMPSEHVHSGI